MNGHPTETPFGLPVDATARPVVDPWRAAESEEPSDASVWLLSYLDVMTLLFAFFAVLFAYQKALTVDARRLAANRAPRVAMAAAPAAPAKSPPPKPVPKTRPVEKATPVAPATESLPPPALAMVPAAPPVSDKQAPAVTPPPEPAWTAELGNATLSNSGPSPDGERGDAVEISQSDGRVRLEISGGILFDPASAELKPQGLELLDRLAQWLGTQVGSVAVEGHTDDRPITGGRYRSNWELSSARASTVARGLIERGISPERLRAVGLAATQPRETNDTPEGRARNRRVSVVVYVPKGKGLKT